MQTVLTTREYSAYIHVSVQFISKIWFIANLVSYRKTKSDLYKVHVFGCYLGLHLKYIKKRVIV